MTLLLRFKIIDGILCLVVDIGVHEMCPGFQDCSGDMSHRDGW